MENPQKQAEVSQILPEKRRSATVPRILAQRDLLTVVLPDNGNVNKAAASTAGLMPSEMGDSRANYIAK
jgi:hypothetical protein